jgi:hypothetical protein
VVVFKAGEEDVESLVELGCSVVVGELGGEAAEEGKLPRGQVEEAQPEQVVALLGVDRQSLSFGEDESVKEADVEVLDV